MAESKSTGRHGPSGSNPIPERAEVCRILSISEKNGTAMVQVFIDGYYDTKHGSLKDPRIKKLL